MTLNDLLNDYTDRPTLAGALGICERTVARYEKAGLPSLMIGGRKLYHIEAVAKFLKSREKKSRVA